MRANQACSAFTSLCRGMVYTFSVNISTFFSLKGPRCEGKLVHLWLGMKTPNNPA